MGLTEAVWERGRDQLASLRTAAMMLGRVAVMAVLVPFFFFFFSFFFLNHMIIVLGYKILHAAYAMA